MNITARRSVLNAAYFDIYDGATRIRDCHEDNLATHWPEAHIESEKAA